jgi:hypothetical protein
LRYDLRSFVVTGLDRPAGTVGQREVSAPFHASALNESALPIH